MIPFVNIAEGAEAFDWSPPNSQGEFSEVSPAQDAVDDLDLLPASSFCDFKVPDYSICTFYTPEFHRRLKKFITIHDVSGPLFSLHRLPQDTSWVRLDDKYLVLSLDSRPIHFWAVVFLNSSVTARSADGRINPTYYITPPWIGWNEMVSVAGYDDVADNVYDARERFLFGRRLPRLDIHFLKPGDMLNVEFQLVEHVVDGRTIRELHARNAYLLWSADPPRVKPKISFPGPYARGPSAVAA